MVAATVQTAVDLQAKVKAEADEKAKAESKNKNWWDKAVDAVGGALTAQAGGSKCSSVAGAAYFVFSAGVSCQYEQAQYYDYDPVENLDIAWHGLVNFGGGVVNALADTVDFVVDVGQTTFNALSPTCWTKTFCAAIPNIPSVPIYGDPDLYKYSQASGYVTTVAVEFVATGGVGAVVDGVSALAAGAKALPRLVTEFPAVVNEVKAVVSGVMPALHEAIPAAKALLSGGIDDLAAIVKAPGEFLNTLKTGLNNPVTTPGGIFGTPPTPRTDALRSAEGLTSDNGAYYATEVLPGGHVSGDTVFAGHGSYALSSGNLTVPEGTWVTTPAELGDGILNSLGLAIERGDPLVPAHVYGPGDVMPNLTLRPPTGLTVLEDSTLVSEPSLLSDLLEPNMGTCHWAACLKERR